MVSRLSSARLSRSLLLLAALYGVSCAPAEVETVTAGPATLPVADEDVQLHGDVANEGVAQNPIESRESEPVEFRETQLDGPGSQPSNPRLGPLLWDPEGPLLNRGAAYDLCNDDEAVEAGLDGGALELERSVLGLTCTDSGASEPRRYGYLGADGSLTYGSTPELARAEAPVATPTGIRLGSSRQNMALLPDLRDREGVEIHPGSVLVRDGWLRGVVVNTSHTMVARSVVVSGPTDNWRFDWPIQPGEFVPFEIVWNDRESVDLAALTVEGHLSVEQDVSRAFLHEISHQFADKAVAECDCEMASADLVTPGIKAGAAYSVFTVQAPTSHPTLALDGQRIAVSNPVAYVALLQGDGRVFDVARTQVWASRFVEDREVHEPALEVLQYGQVRVVFEFPADYDQLGTRPVVWIGGT